jgi:hypothetical protein
MANYAMPVTRKRRRVLKQRICIVLLKKANARVVIVRMPRITRRLLFLARMSYA